MSRAQSFFEFSTRLFLFEVSLPIAFACGEISWCINRGSLSRRWSCVSSKINFQKQDSKSRLIHALTLLRFLLQNFVPVFLQFVSRLGDSCQEGHAPTFEGRGTGYASQAPFIQLGFIVDNSLLQRSISLNGRTKGQC